MEQSVTSYSDRTFRRNYKTLQIFNVLKKFETYNRTTLVAVAFCNGEEPTRALEKMREEVIRKRNFEELKILDPAMECANEITATRVGSEDILLLHEDGLDGHVILEPGLDIGCSKAMYGGSAYDWARGYLILPQNNITLAMFVDEDSVYLWVISEDLVSGPLKTNSVIKSKFSKLELTKQASLLYPGLQMSKIKQFLVCVNPKHQWAKTTLEEINLGPIKFRMSSESSWNHFEYILHCFSDDFSRTRIKTEDEKLRIFFEELDASSGATTSGRITSAMAINQRSTKVILVNEKTKHIVYVLETAGNKEKIIIKTDDEVIGDQYQGQKVIMKLALLPWLNKFKSRLKGDVVLISEHTEHGSRLIRDCDGIGAILDARRYIEPDDE